MRAGFACLNFGCLVAWLLGCLVAWLLGCSVFGSCRCSIDLIHLPILRLLRGLSYKETEQRRNGRAEY